MFWFLFRALFILLLLLLIPAGFYFETEIRRYVPDYSSMLFFSGVICLAGLVYSLLVRNLFIAFITVAVTAALPLLITWTKEYWPF